MISKKVRGEPLLPHLRQQPGGKGRRPRIELDCRLYCHRIIVQRSVRNLLSDLGQAYSAQRTSRQINLSSNQ
jgi:hypothetical protein